MVSVSDNRTSSGMFDLLISDICLPDGSGVDLMCELRSRGSEMPGIALSGFSGENDIRQSHAAGFRVQLVKPVDIDYLLEVIRRETANHGNES